MTTDAPVCDICGELMIEEDCTRCDGEGHINTVECPYCHGEGGSMLSRRKYCYECSGSGYVSDRCPQCYGKGTFLKCSRALVISADVSRKDLN